MEIKPAAVGTGSVGKFSRRKQRAEEIEEKFKSLPPAAGTVDGLRSHDERTF